ncbi:MAG: sn-glycerol-1-phosphate dehydrogenase [Thaumarchaeota archaeon]|nr:sn-glycerol-1-phosphate dehydrogenase [Nitrososphaerota archaeon]
MELPRKVLVGDRILDGLGEFILDLTSEGSALFVAGPEVKRKLGARVEDSMASVRMAIQWYITELSDKQDALRVAEIASSKGVSVVVGLGGGNSVDVAKLGSFYGGKPFVSVPTSASHDGISSPFVSMKGLEKPYSLVARPPIGIFADIDVIADAPHRLLASGCGDLIAKITAVRDWEIAREEVNEYFGKYAANLALMSAEILLDGSFHSDGIRSKEGVRELVEALVSTGVAAGIAGSSRPCSGSEHLITHALDQIAPGKGLHGEKCGVSTILMAKLHGLDWKDITKALESVRCPTTYAELGLGREQVAKAVLLAPSIREERYTILTREKLTFEDALRLIAEAEVA